MTMNLFQKKKPALYEVPEYDCFRAMLCDAARENGDTIAVKYKTKSTPHDVTYTELLSKIDSLGTGLYSLPEPPKKAAILASVGFPPLAALLCTLCSDAVALPLDVSLPFPELIGMINHSGCDTVYFDKSFLSSFREQAKLMPRVKNYICFGLRENEEDRAAGLYSYSAFLEKGQNALDEGDDRYISLTPSNDDDRLIFYKSGNADSLIGAVHTQRSALAAVRGFLGLNILEGRCLSILPFDRPYELICCLLASFCSRTTVCLCAGPKSFQKDLLEYSPDYTMLPPLYVENVWQKLVSVFDRGGQADTFRTLVKTGNALRRIGIDKRRTFFSKIHDMLGGKLEKIYVGGAPINPDAVRFFDDVGVQVLGSYGLTECCGVVSAVREEGCAPESAGVLLPCLQLKIDEPNDGGEGEICIMGDTLMRAYLKNDEETALAVDHAGWFHTGDLGRVDAGGQIFITGKLKNEINLKIGRSVRPEEIESYLTALSFVTGARVYAGKDAHGAELHLCADITLDETQFTGLSKAEKTAAVKEKLDRLNEALPPYKRVKSVRIKKTLGEKADAETKEQGV